MPRIDPSRLLKTLTPLLEPSSGAIKSDKEVDKLYGLMSKFSKKLVSKCVYLNILKSTEAHILDLFMQRGGWAMLYSWTIDATEHKNYPILTEVLYLLLKTPATIDRLKENELPKVVKNLSRDCEREDTKTVALQVYNKWMAIAQNKEIPAEPSSVPAPPVLSTIDSNLLNFQLEGSSQCQGISLPTSMGLQEPTSIVIMEGEHDLTHYIDNTDLTTFETDFNPDVFNSTLDQHLPLDGISTDSGTLVSDAFQVEGLSESQVIPMETTTVEDTPYCVIVKDGKKFLIKLQMLKPENQAGAQVDTNPNPSVPTAVSSSNSELMNINKVEEVVKTPRKRAVKKEPTVTKPKLTIGGKPKMSGGGKPKMMSIGGKPPIKTYEAKTKLAQNKRANSAAAAAAAAGNADSSTAVPAPQVSPFAGGIPNFYKKEEPAGSPTKTANAPGPAPKKTPPKPRSKPEGSVGPGGAKRSSKSAAEAARKALEEEKLRLKVSEQKRIRDQRKKEIELKVQQDKDAETLRALNIKLIPPPVKIPKIPKKAASFSDMIGIPGIKEKASDAKKATTSRSSKENEKSKDKEKSKNEPKTDVVLKPEPPKEPAPPKERKHRVKVFNTGKSRALGLLEDMEQTLDKSKSGKEKDKESFDSGIPDIDIPNSVLLGTGKPSKRPSLDGLVKPGDAKKPKLDEKEKKRDKESKTSDSKKSAKTVLMESDMFMAALTASSSTTKPSRSKRRTSSSGDKDKDKDKDKDLLSPPATAKSSAIKPNLKSPTLDEEPVKPVFNFYRDTLTEEDEPKKESPEPDDPADDIKMDITNTPDSPENPIIDSFTPEENEGKLKSALVIIRSKDKPKKSVRWRDDDVLTQFCYFEMDETERVNVSRPAGGAQIRNFAEMKSMERSDERKLIVTNKRKSLLGVEDKMEEKIDWKPLSRIEFVKGNMEVPIHSRELLIQEEREKGILGVFYFYKSQIPESPEEAEDVLVLNQDDSFMKLIPWEDLPNTNLKKVTLTPIKWEGVPDNPNPVNRPPSIPTEAVPNNVLNTNGHLPEGFNLAAMMQNQPPFGNMAQQQQQAQAVAAQFNLWNGNPFNMAAAGMQPGSDMWNMAAAAAATAAAVGGAQPQAQQQGFPNMTPNPGMNMNMMATPGFPINSYAGFNPAFPPPTGMVPPPQQQQQQQPPQMQDDFPQFGPGDHGRFNGPPQRGRGGRGRPNDHRNHHNNGDRNMDDREHGGFRRDRDERDNNRGNFNRDREDYSGRGRGHYNNRGDRGGRDHRDDRRGGDRDYRGGPGGERNRGARTVICKFFKSGFCKTGDMCDFLHPGINGPDRGGSSRHSRFSSRGSSPPSRSSRFDVSPPRSRSDRSDRDRERDRSRERDSDRGDRRGSRERENTGGKNENWDTPASPPPPASPTTPGQQTFNQPPSSPTNQEAALEMPDAPKVIPSENESVVVLN